MLVSIQLYLKCPIGYIRSFDLLKSFTRDFNMVSLFASHLLERKIKYFDWSLTILNTNEANFVSLLQCRLMFLNSIMILKSWCRSCLFWYLIIWNILTIDQLISKLSDSEARHSIEYKFMTPTSIYYKYVSTDAAFRS